MQVYLLFPFYRRRGWGRSSFQVHVSVETEISQSWDIWVRPKQKWQIYCQIFFFFLPPLALKALAHQWSPSYMFESCNLRSNAWVETLVLPLPNCMAGGEIRGEDRIWEEGRGLSRQRERERGPTWKRPLVKKKHLWTIHLHLLLLLSNLGYIKCGQLNPSPRVLVVSLKWKKRA